MRNFLFNFLLITSLIGIVAVVAYEKVNPDSDLLMNRPAELTASEYKILLNSEKFETMDEGAYAYLEIIKKAAESVGVAVHENKGGIEKKKYREVRILDTPNYDFRKHGYLVRERRKLKNDKTPKPGFEYVIKYRGKDIDVALTKDVSINKDFKPDSDEKELESDVVFFSIETGEPLITYSVQNKLVLDAIPELKVGSFIEIFPVLASFGLDVETPLVEVGGQTTFETKVELGELDFGEGLICEMDFIVREMTIDGSKFNISEFSYGFPYEEGVAMPEKAMKLNIGFMEILRDTAPEWVIPGKLKSRYLYND